MIIEVPYPPKLSGPDPRPPQAIALPFAVNARFGLAEHLLFPLLILGPIVLHAMPGRSLPLASKMILAVLWLVFLTFTIVAWRDARGPQPVLLITDDGIHDRRATAAPVPWSDVDRVVPRCFKYSVMGVTLKLKRAVAARPNSFRPRGFVIRWRRKPDEVYVPFRLLSATPDVLFHVIGTLVEKNGGTVGPRTF